MLRYRNSRIQRLRIAAGAAMFAALAGAPLLLGLTRPHADAVSAIESEVPGVVGVYTQGLASLGVAGIVAGILATVFGLWLIAGQLHEVNRRWLQQGVRNKHNLIEGGRTFAVIFGGVGLIVGSLAGLYAAMMTARPDLRYELPIPFFTFELAVPCLLIGGALYAAGRFGR